MPISSRNVRIGGASLIALLLVVGGYVLPGIGAPNTKTVNAALTDELLADYVAKDTDNDKLPDWQEVLYGTDSNTADTDGDGITDGEAVRQGLLTPVSLAAELPTNNAATEDIPGEPPAPGSFTEQFSRSFFEEYMRANTGEPLDDSSKEAVVTKLLGEFTRKAAASLTSSYTRVSMRTDAFGSATTYAGNVERALDIAIPTAPNSDMFLLTQAVIEQGDEAAAERLDVLGGQYLAAARALLAVPAPPGLVESHLRLVRAFEQAGRAAKAVSTYKTDPLLTMGALSVLLPARTDILLSFDQIAGEVILQGEPLPGNPGFYIVDTVRREQEQ
ncbi:MAG TPA: hypothetical protein VGB97_04055 [Candidatus Paceibacterota bacterium]|jgi:hypothetical protein